MNAGIQNKLIAIAENDDRGAFNEIFKFYYPGMISYAKTLVNDRDAAQDLIQELFLNLWKNRKTLTAINNLSTYLYTSLKYNAYHYLKSRNKNPAISLDDNSERVSLSDSNPEELIVHKENLEKIEQMINALPAKCRMIFRLIKEDGLKYKDVASLLNISVKTVANHMTLAHSRLIEYLSEFIPAEKQDQPPKSSTN